MQSNYRLAVSDIDGTLATIGELISDENKRAVRRLQEAGIEVALASGRHHDNMRQFFEPMSGVHWIISSQGAKLAYHDESTTLYEGFMKCEDVSALVQEGMSLGFSILIYTRRRVLTPERTEWIEFYENYAKNTVETLPIQEITASHAYKIVWIGPEELAASMVSQGWQRPGILGMRTQPNLFEIMPETSTKGYAVSVLAKHLGIELEQVITLGDAINDVSMLAIAGCGIAMPHSTPEALAAARMVGPDAQPSVAFAAAVDRFFSMHR
jgi:Cof subfamily protein (haloacid dehalogenase superfamily)